MPGGSSLECRHHSHLGSLIGSNSKIPEPDISTVTLRVGLDDVDMFVEAERRRRPNFRSAGAAARMFNISNANLKASFLTK